MTDRNLDNIQSYSISPNGLEGRIKSSIIFGHWGSVIAPLAYIKKPKWMTEEDFKTVVEHLKLNLPTDIERRDSNAK